MSIPKVMLQENIGDKYPLSKPLKAIYMEFFLFYWAVNTLFSILFSKAECNNSHV